MESIPGLLKRLQIRALDQRSANTFSKRDSYFTQDTYFISAIKLKKRVSKMIVFLLASPPPSRPLFVRVICT